MTAVILFGVIPALCALATLISDGDTHDSAPEGFFGWSLHYASYLVMSWLLYALTLALVFGIAGVFFNGLRVWL